MIFYKTSSFGNDFIEIDRSELACPQGRRPLGGLTSPQGRRPLGGLAREICDRQRGVGADGVVFYRLAGRKAASPGDHALEKAALRGYRSLRGGSLKRLSSSPGAEFQIFNRDGGEAELSGNGMAGLSAVLFQRRLAASPLTLHAASGSRRVELLGREGPVFQLNVEIGKPDFADRGFFPFLGEKRQPFRCAGVGFHPVSVGNPHAVVICRQMPPAGQLAALGEKIEGHAMFPKRVNVEFVHLTSAAIPLVGTEALRPASPTTGTAALRPARCQVYFYERGVGPTLASSTGSAAVFAVLRRLGMAGDRLVIDLDAEKIELNWNDGIFLRNITRIICRGDYFL